MALKSNKEYTMKRIIYFFCAAVILCCTSCNKENVNNIPDLSGKYICSFSIPDTPPYSASGTIDIQKNGDSGFTVSGSEPFQKASLFYISGQQYQFRIPQTDIVRNGKTYYITLTATLTYEGGIFKTYSCQAAYGEKGVSGNTYNVSNFKLKKQ